MRNQQDWQKFYEAHVKNIMEKLQFAITAITVVGAFVTVATFTSIKELKDDLQEKYKIAAEEAKNVAMRRVNELVDLEFKEKKMSELISKIANEKLDLYAQNYINKKADILNEEILELITTSVSISLAIDDIRFSDRKGLEYLENEINNPKSNQNAKLAMKAFEKKARDYDRYLNDKEINIPNTRYCTFPFDPKNLNKDIDLIMNNLIDTIKYSQNLENVSHSVSAIRKITNKPFKMFDFKTINNWYKVEYPKERSNLQKILLTMLP